MLVRMLLLAILVLPTVRAEPTPIPAFTPNVVDSAGVLDVAAYERVNAEILRLREAGTIWGAVYIVPALGEESIEELAVRAFETWQLGQAGVDNGLLLVLAIQDRRSRFEVGYGLEGSITDVAALRALDAYLAPRMREGDTAGAIVDAFGFLSRVVQQDPAAAQELADASASSGDSGEDWGRGLRAWGMFLVPVWLGVPLYRWWAAWRRQRLLEAHPQLKLRGDEVVANAGETATAAAGGKSKTIPWGTIGVCSFLTLNPGIFIFILSALEKWVYYGSMILPGFFLLLVTWLKGRKYGSPERYEKHLQNVAKERADLLSRGHLVRDPSGIYRYTPAYHASRRSSSSSSSSRSSSSGGGRSGGGGASSGW